MRKYIKLLAATLFTAALLFSLGINTSFKNNDISLDQLEAQAEVGFPEGGGITFRFETGKHTCTCKRTVCQDVNFISFRERCKYKDGQIMNDSICFIKNPCEQM